LHPPPFFEGQAMPRTLTYLVNVKRDGQFVPVTMTHWKSDAEREAELFSGFVTTHNFREGTRIFRRGWIRAEEVQ